MTKLIKQLEEQVEKLSLIEESIKLQNDIGGFYGKINQKNFMFLNAFCIGVFNRWLR